VKKCTQCGQMLSDETKFCFKCGGSNFEPAEEAVGTYQQTQQPPQQSYYEQPPQQSYYTQPPSYQPQPAYRHPVNDEVVSTGMNFLFLFISYIPLVNLIFAIVVAASSGFKRSYRNLAKAWLILFVILLILSIISYFVIRQYVLDFLNNYFGVFEFDFYG
jgi:hypothetical protein